MSALRQSERAAQLADRRCQRCAHRFRALHWGHRYPHPGGERRDYERVVVRLRARLTAGTESAEAETTDVSITGCAVRTSAHFPPGTEVRVTLHLGPGRTVEVAEAVVRAAREDRVSLQFVHIGVEEQRRLAEYVNAVALPIDVGRPLDAPTPVFTKLDPSVVDEELARLAGD